MLGDVCLNHSVAVDYRLSPDAQRGVFKVRLRALRAVPNEGVRRVAQYEMRFPNSTVGGLGAALFRCANQLDRILTYDKPPETDS